MKRFIKTYTVRRHAILIVEQDGDARFFRVWEWQASDAGVRGPQSSTSIWYGEDRALTLDEARQAACDVARARVRELGRLRHEG